MTELEVLESFTYIYGVFPPKGLTERLLTEGPDGSEEHTISGDDLAGAVWHLDRLMDHFGYPKSSADLARMQWELYKAEKNN